MNPFIERCPHTMENNDLVILNHVGVSITYTKAKVLDTLYCLSKKLAFCNTSVLHDAYANPTATIFSAIPRPA